MKLTKRAVDILHPEHRDKDYYDDALKSFGVRVRKSGRKTYFVMSRERGRLRRITLGQHGALTTEEARKMAMKVIHDLSVGIDPTAEKKKLKATGTVRSVCERFLKEYVLVHLKPSTQREYHRSIKLFIIPKLGPYPIADITRADVAALHHGLRDRPYQANRTLGVISVLFNQAELWGLRDELSNPCRGIKKYKEQKRERFLSIEELGRLGDALDAEEDFAPAAVACVRLLLLTGCRLGEIQKLEWSHVDFERQMLHLPDSKTGRKTVYLGDAAIDVLNAIPRLQDNPFVISGRVPGQYLTDMQKPWRRIRSVAKLEDVRLHDLRHTFASSAVSLGENLPMVGKLLGHSQPQTTARYAHLADAQAASAADKVSEALSQSLRRQRVERQPVHRPSRRVRRPMKIRRPA